MSQPIDVRAGAATAVDAVLEASVVGSFTRIGPAVRRRLEHWVDPPAVAGRTMVITGATSGLGLAAACALSRRGANLVLVGRDPTRSEQARRTVRAVSTGGRIDVELADLGDLEQVRRLGERLLERLDRLDVLINNAGALLRNYTRAPDGHELTITVHLLAQFALTQGLLPLLEASAPSRVITMTSGGMYTQKFSLGTLVMSEDDYDGTVAYARAKRAQVVLTHELQRRFGPKGVDFHVVHPGWADTPGVHSGLPTFTKVVGPLFRTPEVGADTAVWLAGQPDGEPEGGQLWLDRRPRGLYRLPWTYESEAELTADGEALYEWCKVMTAH
jgi:NAD(P)-dependent dehydrogenase (short-subunit alcohol dehydrogenase family)